MSSLLKCILMLQKNMIPPQAGLPNTLNPKFAPLSESRITIHEEATSFEPGDEPRRLLLNNFDAAGGNACVLIEEYTRPARASADADADKHLPWSNHVVVASGKTEASLSGNKHKLLDWLRANADARIQDVAYTTTARRLHHQLRSSYVASTTEELITKLEADTAGSPEQGARGPRIKAPKPVVFIFTGQGSHYAGMGSELYRSSSIFRDKVDHCVRICAENAFPPFLDFITNTSLDVAHLDPSQTQLATLVLEIALADVWRSEAGVQPSMVVGHSLGEYAALHVAGVLSLVDVLYLVGHRARLLSQLCEAGSCAMLAVAAPVEQVRELLDARPGTTCDVACINSPRATVLSGLVDCVNLLKDDLKDTRTKVLPIPYAFHSVQMDPVLAEYAALANGITYSAPKTPVASTLLAQVVAGQAQFSASYLCRQMREPVSFSDTVNAVKQSLGDAVWLEIGPSQVCGPFVQATLSPAPSPGSVVSTLETGVGQWASFSKCLGRLFDNGVQIDWHRFYSAHTSRVKLLTLPTYSWDLQNFWITHTEKHNRHGGPISSKEPHATQAEISTCAQSVVETKKTSTQTEATLRAALSTPAFDSLIEGHRIRDVAICPGSAFCDAALTAAKYLLESSGQVDQVKPAMLAIRDLTLHRPLAKTQDSSTGELLTTAILESPSSGGNSVAVSFGASSSRGTNYNLGSCTVALHRPEHVQQTWDRTSYYIKSRMDSIIEAAKAGQGHRFRHGIFYSLFSGTVKYHSGFRAVEEAYVSEDFAEAAAEVILPSDPAGTHFTISPYHGESLVHLAGFVLNADPGRPRLEDTTFMMDKVSSIEQTGVLVPGRRYSTFTRVIRRAGDTATSDVYVFDGDSLVMCCSGLRFHEVSNAVLDRLLGKSSTGAVVRPSAPLGQPAQEQPRVLVESKPKLSPTNEPLRNTTPDVAEPKAAAPSHPRAAASSGVFEAILKTISKATGVDVSELTDNTAVGDLGVDSIMAIEITAAVKKQTGRDLPVAFVIEHPTVADLRREFAEPGADDEGDAEPLSSSPGSQMAEWEVVSGKAGLASQDMLDESHSQIQSLTPGSTPSPATTPAVVPTPRSETPQAAADCPEPQARITLLHGRKKSGKTPLYLIADGTGSMATYIHLPPLKSKAPVYGVDSPFLRCPERMARAETAIQEAAAHIIEAITRQQPTGPLYVGGFSGGGMMGYEVCRQLAAAGRPAAGLVLIDICCPRSSPGAGADEAGLIKVSPEAGLRMFQAVASRDAFWNTDTESPSMRHLLAVVKAVTAYRPPALAEHERPGRAAIIWAERGLVGRCRDDPELMKILVDGGFPTEAYRGFMEDMTLGGLAWGVPHKFEDKEGGLGPNGWDKYIGEALCLSVDADHIDMPLPGHVKKLHGAIEKALAYIEGSE